MKKTAFKLHILYEFREGPWGGGNQFLKALREYFRREGAYAESPDEAQAVLFNSHHLLGKIINARRKYPNKIFIHRVDGPISLIRNSDRAIDLSIFRINSMCADGTVFQSNWSREKNHAMGMGKTPYETVITNAPDPAIFHPEVRTPPEGRRIKLIATSWSDNVRRGFDTYKFLDEHLDFSRYEMTFVGNSPVSFKNIKWIKPVPSRELASLLREHDIYVAASRNDPCSNALIEALHCGLPAVARNDGGHPEITGSGGTLFENDDGVIKAIEAVAQNYAHYQAQIKMPTLDEIGRRYYEFALGIYEYYLKGSYHPRRINPFDFICFRANTLMRAAQNKACAAVAGLGKKGRGL